MKFIQEKRNYNSDCHIFYGNAADASYFFHWHSEIEILLVKCGQMKVTINENSHIVKEGDLIIIQDKDIHGFEVVEKPLYWNILIFHPELLKSINNNSLIKSHVITSKQLDENGISDYVKDFFEKVKIEYDSEDLYSKQLFSSMIIEFLIRIIRKFPLDSDMNKKSSKQIETLTLLQYVFENLERNYSNPISLKEAAELIHLSPWYFAKIFKKFTHMTFTNYLNTLRINKSIDKLINTDEKIVNISENCGFSSLRNFNRIFKSVTGKTPKDFR